MARAVVLALMACWFVGGFQSTVGAASCIPPDKAQFAKTSDGVFVGTTGDMLPGKRHTRYVDVTLVYKGDPDSTVAFNTGEEREGVGSSEDFDLPADRTLIFFASGSGDAWAANVCEHPIGATAANLALIETILGSPTRTESAVPPVEDAAVEDGSSSWWAYVLLAGGGALIAVVLVRARRRGRATSADG